MNPQLLTFDYVPFAHIGSVDAEKGIVHGVSLITGGIKARGHDLLVDDTTLQQLFDCATKMGQVPVKWNHKTGADAVNGFVTNFHIDGDKLRGDWHLLKKHAQFEQALELATRMPGNIGLSAAFVPPAKLGKNDQGKARCEELVSVDLVAQPAANPDGLLSDSRFEVDNSANGKSMDPKLTTTPTEPTLAELMQVIQQQGEQIKQLTESFQSLAQNPGDQPDLTDLANWSDEQLVAAGYDPSEVDAAIQSAIQSGELTVEGADPGDQGGQGQGAEQGAVSGAVGAELSAIRKELNHFKAKENREIALEAKAEEDKLLHAFDVVEAKCIELAARNDALRVALNSGGQGRVASTGSEIQLDAKTGEPVKFEEIVNAEFNRLMKKGGVTELQARSKAIDFGVKRHTAAYREFRSSGRAQIEFSVAD